MMRRLLILFAVLLFAVVPAASLAAPAKSYAAPAQALRTAIYGRLVGTPKYMALPGNILLQVGAATWLVRLTNATRITDRNENLITFGDLKARHMLQVMGYNRGAGVFEATEVRDMSLNTTITLQFKGSLASMPNWSLLCVSAVTIVSTNAPRAFTQTASPCPSGTLPVYLSNRTHVLNQVGSGAHTADFRVGDNLAIVASLVRGQIIASSVQDLTLPVLTNLQVQGQLQSQPAANLLCLVNAQFTASVAPRLNAQVASPCSDASALPVYLTSSTHFQDAYAKQTQQSNLKIGDTLQLSGPIVNGQFTPTVIRDLSLQTAFSTVTGTLVAQPQGNSFPASLLIQVGGQTYLVTVYDTTVILNGAGQPIALANLVTGNTLVIYGTLNGSQIAALRVQDTSITPGTSVDLKGTVAIAPGMTNPANLLCLSGAALAPQIQAQAVLPSPCASGQLPVYLNAGTQLLNHLGFGIGTAQIKVNDAVHVLGSLVSGQVNASAITDLSD